MNTNLPTPILAQLQKLDPKLAELVLGPDAFARLNNVLPRKCPLKNLAAAASHRPWLLCGHALREMNRWHEALATFRALYVRFLQAQALASPINKGDVLFWISDCYRHLGWPVHAKRSLMLALCEDAVHGRGVISPTSTGTYWQLVWLYGVPEARISSYATELYRSSKKYAEEAQFPEAMLQRLAADDWATEVPAPEEVSIYHPNTLYVRFLLNKVGASHGEGLELLGQYLLSCIAGCRVSRRRIAKDTEHDLLCTLEGAYHDFRSELGRYFICECKDLQQAADFTATAKFCRVLDSVKARFGIMFSRNNISGRGRSRYAERAQLKVFHDRGIVIVVIDKNDVSSIAAGANFIALLRERYEEVRLDLQ